jgi:hypothetical protein
MSVNATKSIDLVQGEKRSAELGLLDDSHHPRLGE